MTIKQNLIKRLIRQTARWATASVKIIAACYLRDGVHLMVIRNNIKWPLSVHRIW
jgi:REP element-mobilizing transposase RayT